MPYTYLEDVATADVAFEATGPTSTEMFVQAARATMNVMVEDLDTIALKEKRSISITEDTLENLLFNFLQEFIYYKDAEKLLLLPIQVNIQDDKEQLTLTTQVKGEVLDPARHELNVDVKAVTWHRFDLSQSDQGWQCVVVLDI